MKKLELGWPLVVFAPSVINYNCVVEIYNLRKKVAEAAVEYMMPVASLLIGNNGIAPRKYIRLPESYGI